MNYKSEKRLYQGLIPKAPPPKLHCGERISARRTSHNSIRTQKPHTPSTV